MIDGKVDGKVDGRVDGKVDGRVGSEIIGNPTLGGGVSAIGNPAGIGLDGLAIF